ncbi:MAG: YkgJ family cysteine cluster protein [Methanothrix sp.]|nr:MAG: YkgJ family cysteine cluster protein [Methanothrix sp.]
MSRDGQRAEQIKQLCADLEAAKELSADVLLRQIQEIGFQCQRCGECCTGDDNSVVVFPFEVRRILAAAGLQWLEAVEPPKEGEWDRNGCFHTLEWRLKKEGASCKFYSKTACGMNGFVVCRIYESRPLICSTYPFYLDRGVLHFSECRGLGGMIEPDKAKELAKLLILRYVTEIREAVALLEKYEDFERGGPEEDGRCIVHDSEGAHSIFR